MMTVPCDIASVPSADISQVVHNLEHQTSVEWHGLSVNPRTAPGLKAKLYTYFNWFKLPQAVNPYCLLQVSDHCMKRFVHFRLTSHSLPVKAGRHIDPRPPFC